MIKPKVLITDSLFIFKEHEKQLLDAGFEIERLDKPEATEAELIAAIKGKTGYILGGVEHVTEPVLEAADQLKAIVFTGIDYKSFIPAWELAVAKGITIANVPEGPTDAVAEWAITMALAMNRSIFELGRLGDKTFKTTKGLKGQHVGFVGFGRIGSQIAEMVQVFQPASVSYFSQTKKNTDRYAFPIEYKNLASLFSDCDIIFLCVPKNAGDGFINRELLAAMKDDALLINMTHPGVVDEAALIAELQSGRIRAASDHPFIGPGFKELPLSHWYCFNGSNAFNTVSSIQYTSDRATKLLIENLLNS